MCPYSHDSDSDFEDQPKIVRKRKKRASVLDDTSELQDESLSVHSEPQGDASDITKTTSPLYLNWEELPADMQSVLPPDEEYTLFNRTQFKKLNNLPLQHFLLFLDSPEACG